MTKLFDRINHPDAKTVIVTFSSDNGYEAGGESVFPVEEIRRVLGDNAHIAQMPRPWDIEDFEGEAQTPCGLRNCSIESSHAHVVDSGRVYRMANEVRYEPFE